MPTFPLCTRFLGMLYTDSTFAKLTPHSVHNFSMVYSAYTIFDMDSPSLSNDILLDDESNLPSEWAKLMKQPTPTTMHDKLSIENFRLVKNLADKVCFLKLQQECSYCFLAYIEGKRPETTGGGWGGYGTCAQTFSLTGSCYFCSRRPYGVVNVGQQISA